MYFSKNQLGFFMGWNNDFDIIRIGLRWKDYETAKLCIVICGFMVVWCFRAHSFYETKRRIKTWWNPCPDCGGRFGKHDDKVEHLPF